MTRSFGPALLLTTEQHTTLRAAVTAYGPEKLVMLTVGKAGDLLSLVGQAGANPAITAEAPERIAQAWVMLHLLAQVFGERAVRDRAQNFIDALEKQLRADGHIK